MNNKKDIEDIKDDIRGWLVDNWQISVEDGMLQTSRKYYKKME